MASNPIVARWLLMIRRIVAESSMTRIFTGFAPARKGARVEPEAQTWPNVPQATRVVELSTALWSRQTGGLISFWPASVPRGDLKCQRDYSTSGAAPLPPTLVSRRPRPPGRGASDRQRGRMRRVLAVAGRSEEHTSELQSRLHLVCRLLLEKKKKNK